jgi:Protein of unknown function (DUF2809)
MATKSLRTYRWALVMSMIVIVPIGYLVRFHGVFPGWLNDALGGVAYEIFWILLVGFLFPKLSIVRVALGVCLATCAIEVLQLWTPDWLQALRRTLPGRLVLGNTFTWADFPVYGVGSLAGWGWVRSIQGLFKMRP